MENLNPEVDWFFNKDTKWQQAYSELRRIVLECGLNEELKWGCPCYNLQKNNIVLIHGFKTYCALLFMQGALINDEAEMLVQQTKNVQSARQLRFTTVDQILQNETIIKTYLEAAIAIDKAGLKYELKKTAAFEIPDEFREVLNEMPEVKTAFESLTPGRQRGYLLYFSAAKQAKTRVARIEKYLPKILDGKGVDDVM
ncbi:MAG: YdeI/OmpD-associated family protein [Bacteroidota bacterium]